MKRSRSPIIFVALISFSLGSFPVTSLAQSRTVRARVTQPVDQHNLVTLRGNIHPLARPEFDQGVAPDDLPMERMLLVLQRGQEQEVALRQLLDDQQVKSSPQFHRWLTPEQFGQQFGPADSDLQAVTDWLASQGFQVTKVAVGRTVIEFSGTAGLVRQVLGAEMHRFRVNGQDHWANTGDPQIPAALAPVVAGFVSLNNFPRKPLTRQMGTFSRSKLTGEVQPLFTYPTSCGSGSGTCYYIALGPTDFATIYNVLPLWNAATPTDGTGVTIAVVGETNINLQDVADFRQMFGLPANAPNIILNGPDPGITSFDENEADLDVQWSGAIAKRAAIDYVVSESTETTPGIDLSALYIVDNNLAPIMSESYGMCEAELGAGGNQFYNTLWEQAAAQGITVLLGSGDSGSATCDSANLGETSAQYGLGVSGLASTPFNVAVGGTDFNITSSNAATYWSTTNTPGSQSSAKSYIPESTWNDSCAASGSLAGCTPPPSSTYLNEGAYLFAGGGGPSSCTTPAGTFPSVNCNGGYAKPSWQSGTNVPNDGARDIPDLSLFAGGHSFYVTCQMDANALTGGSSNSCDLSAPYTNFQGGGGTSASVQVFAGIMALVNQRYGPQGNANYVLYPMAARSGASCNSSTAPVTNSSCVFYDVTVGNNSVICQGGTPNCSNANSGQYGIMVSAGSAAYPTKTGYDLATGLGSVNVANLVNNWTSTFTKPTTTLALSTTPPTNPITLTHGQPINFTVSVAPGSGSGTPTGDVSLIPQTGSSASNVTGIGPFTLSGGSVASSTNMLPGGSYNVTAHYAGNGTFAASDSNPGIPVTVAKESSQTKIRLVTFDLNTGAPSYGATTTAYGSPYVLRMDVMHGSDRNPCASTTPGLISYPCPTGALTVSPAPTNGYPPSNTVVGNYTLNSQGYAEDQPIQQPAGVYNFVASYAGDNSYESSTSPTVPITITNAPTTTTMTGLPPTVVAGPASLTVTVGTQSNGVAPSGFVQLMNGNNSLPAGGDVSYTNGSATRSASIQESLQPSLQVGTYNITAQYPGDTNYAASASAPVVVNVTDFSVSANPTAFTISAAGQSGSSTISLTPLNGFTGTVGLYCSSGYDYAGVSCAVSPSSVNITGSSPVTATVTVSTTAPANSLVPTPTRRVPPTQHLPVGWPWVLAGLLTVAMLMGLTAAGRRPLSWWVGATLLVMGAWVACGGGGGGGGSGSGPPPAPLVSLSPPSLTFAQQTMGSTSGVQSVTLSNTGNASLNISSVAIGGANPGDFAQTNICSSSMAANTNCAINVTFTPAAMGSRSASLTIADDANGSPQTVSLAGTGTAGPAVSLSPQSLAFGQENMSSRTPPQSVTLSNTGNTALNISSIGIGGLYQYAFGQTNNCGSSLAVGSNCTINVTFAPTSLGAQSGSVVTTDNAPGSPQLVSLSGTAIPPLTPAGTYPMAVSAGAPIGGSNIDYHIVWVNVTVQ